MPKNANGKVEISRFAYDPELKVTSANIVQILGSLAVRMTEEQKKKAVIWFRNLKIKVGIFCRDRIMDEILKNCKAKGLPLNTSKDLQNLWLNADTGVKREEAADAINDAMEVGYFKTSSKSKTNWKYPMEAEVMENFKLEYLPNEGQLLGCLARHATRSMNDVRKKIQEPGRKKHGFIITRKCPRGMLSKRGKGKVVVRLSEKKSDTGPEARIESTITRDPSTVKKNGVSA